MKATRDRSAESSSSFEPNPWCVGRRIVVWAHHKTGTVMGRYASRLLNEGYSQHCVDSGHSMVSFECEVCKYRIFGLEFFDLDFHRVMSSS